MVPFMINPIYTLYTGYLLGISPFQKLLAGVKQLGSHPQHYHNFPYEHYEYLTSNKSKHVLSLSETNI